MRARPADRAHRGKALPGSHGSVSCGAASTICAPDGRLNLEIYGSAPSSTAPFVLLPFPSRFAQSKVVVARIGLSQEFGISWRGWGRKQLPKLELHRVLMFKHIDSSFPSYEMHTGSSNRSIACSTFFHRINISCSGSLCSNHIPIPNPICSTINPYILSATLFTSLLFSPPARTNNSRARPQLLPPSN